MRCYSVMSSMLAEMLAMRNRCMGHIATSTPVAVPAQRDLVVCVQAYWAGVLTGQQKVSQARQRNQKLEEALNTRGLEQNAAAVQAAARVASLEQHLQHLKVSLQLALPTLLVHEASVVGRLC